MHLVAHKAGVKLPPETAVDAEVDLGTTRGEYFLRVRLNVNLPGVDRDAARRIVDEAHETCPYSKAVHGNVEVQTNLTGVEAAAATA
jgi:Ohr subfamily peroxiredoxin